MKFPLVILAICAVVAGFIPFAHFVTSDGVALETHMDLGFSAVPVALSILAILLASVMYRVANDKPEKVASTMGGLYKAASRKFYMDELYLFITKKIIFPLIGQPIAWIDKNIVDGLMNWLASVTARISELIKGLQSGKVQNYALYFFGGVAALAVLFIYIWK